MCLPPVKFSLGSFRVFYSRAVVEFSDFVSLSPESLIKYFSKNRLEMVQTVVNALFQIMFKDSLRVGYT